MLESFRLRSQLTAGWRVKEAELFSCQSYPNVVYGNERQGERLRRGVNEKEVRKNRRSRRTQRLEEKCPLK